jgi:hypothetical protein
MNFVFQGLALLAFMLPGILFRSAYKKAFWNYPLGRLGPISDQIPRSLVHSSWLNAIWAVFVGFLSDRTNQLIRPIDFDSVIYWLTNNFGKDQKYIDKAVASLSKHPFQIFAYFIGMYAFSIVCGWLVHLAVRRSGADKQWAIFRFDNDWFYQFKGEVLDFPDYDSTPKSKKWWTRKTKALISENKQEKMRHKDWKGTLVAAVVDLKDNSFLYLGIYIDSFFDGSGNLDRILIAGAKRRKLSSDPQDHTDDLSHVGTSRYYPIKGDFFILRMTEVKTLNMAYFSDELRKLADDAANFEEYSRIVAELEAEVDSEDP